MSSLFRRHAFVPCKQMALWAAARGAWIALLIGCGRSDPSLGRGPAQQKGSVTQVPGISASARPTAPQAVSAPASSSASYESRTPTPESWASEARELTWVFDGTPWGDLPVVVRVPARTHAKQRFPVLVAFHGRGEALKGPGRGARGWVDDYWLPAAIQHLERGRLVSSDFLGIVDLRRLEQLNTALAQSPYAGLIVVCPYTPEPLGRRAEFSRLAPMAELVVTRILPQVYRNTPALAGASSTGIDGVSLGGRVALLVGLLRPEAFGAIGALQPAFDTSEAEALAQLAAQAQEKRQPLHLRLLSSDGDFFLEATRSISRRLRAAHVAHEFLEIPGPHNYEFNRGPGVLEMLMFHNRVLAALPPRALPDSGQR